jgi:diketogulonate reductase-like aldo/keto reductase
MPIYLKQKNIPTITLNNGIEIPIIGNGPMILGYDVRQISLSGKISLIKKVYNKFIEKNRYVENIAFSFQLGLTLLDFSVQYGNQGLIGKAIKKSGVKREKLFLTTRVGNKQQLIGNIREQLFQTLDCYKTDYVDLYMFHWPVPNMYIDTWNQMEQLKKEGYCRAIGVANCNQRHLEEIIKNSYTVPAINQIEVHPLFTQKPLIDYCRLKNIVVEAYTPIARYDDRLFRLPTLKNIASKYHKTSVQVILRWHIQNNTIPIVRSLKKKHQIENISIFDFELSKEEMKIIDSFNINSRLRYDPENCDFSIV